MKKQKRLLVFSYLIILFLVSSCEQDVTKIVTPQPTISATNIIFQTSTSTLTLTPSLTPVPTLSSDDATNRLLELLETNGNCKLPCLWGISPIKNSFLESLEILMPLNLLSAFPLFEPSNPISIHPRYVNGDLEIYTGISVYTNPEKDVVNRIWFYVEARKPLTTESGYEYVFDSAFYSQIDSAYMLPHVLSEQGIPESVLISTSGGPLTRGGTGGFEIALLYPDQGVFVHYETQMHIIGKNVQGCPQSPLVWMELFPPENAENFFVELEKTKWPYFKEGFKPIEETTSLSIEEFYDLFSKPTEKCIETPKELWPIPEP